MLCIISGFQRCLFRQTPEFQKPSTTNTRRLQCDIFGPKFEDSRWDFFERVVFVKYDPRPLMMPSAPGFRSRIIVFER